MLWLIGKEDSQLINNLGRWWWMLQLGLYTYMSHGIRFNEIFRTLKILVDSFDNNRRDCNFLWKEERKICGFWKFIKWSGTWFSLKLWADTIAGCSYSYILHTNCFKTIGNAAPLHAGNFPHNSRNKYCMINF